MAPITISNSSLFVARENGMVKLHHHQLAYVNAPLHISLQQHVVDKNNQSEKS